jgi:transposase-like protein/Zn finger protein HypA/HybF involved in hydrogenase expression
MSKIARFVIWICSKFTRNEIEQIINSLLDILNNLNPEVKPKDDFKEKHPNYRVFSVDPLPPLSEPPQPKQSVPQKDYKELLKNHLSTCCKPLKPVKHRVNSKNVPLHTRCPNCNAPHEYIYYNDGKKMSQLKCKVCNHLFQLNQRFRKNSITKYYCPYCHYALFTWKVRKELTIYKCCNDNCQHRLSAINKLNPSEKVLLKQKSSQFKLCYQFREYHYKPDELQHSAPHKPSHDLSKIHNSPNILGLILTFYVSFALSARKTALILRSVFNIKVSYQTVLNYAAASAFYCHSFNLKYKGSVDDIQAGDETYIKVIGKHHYVFFFISCKSLKITAYHVADNRGAQPAIAAMKEAVRTANPDQKLVLVTDGNASYPAGIHYINQSEIASLLSSNVQHRKVIGLQNLDDESEDFRAFKQLIERLNRTYKYHVKPSHGFNCFNGAVALTTLFVTHYNFLRPHMSLKYKTPIQLAELEDISTIQGKWAKILSLAT